MVQKRPDIGGGHISEPSGDSEFPTTADRVRALSSPSIYPRIPHDVEIKETHMSWVFLAGGEVYKLKKPVKYPFLNFSTLKARAANAREEVRLNRRLAPDVYLGVVALTHEKQDRIAIGGEGQIIDWLVHMRRLPEPCMLDTAIANETVRRDQIDSLAERLAVFYRQAVRADIAPEAYAARFEREQAETRAVLLHSDVALESGETKRTLDRVDAAARRLRPLLEDRVRRGHVVDGHGDLRPEHVCLLEPPVVIDCLEFNRPLRLVDPFEELVFLGFECARLGAPWIRPRLLDHCSELLNDHPPEPLIDFYAAFRALVRARLALAHLFEPETPEPEKWRPLARRYVEIAAGAV